MSRAEPLRRATLAITLLASAGGVALQYALLVEVFARDGGNALGALWRLVIFFTILTNLFVAAVCLSVWRQPQSETFLAKPSTQAAAALYIAVVGITYALILAKLWNPQGWQYVADLLIHRISPVAFVIYWLVFTPKGALRWSTPPWWLIYPLIYLVYALVRGAAGGFYPYPFIDVAAHGATTVAVNSVVMLALFVALAFAIVAIDRWIGARGA